MRTPGHRHPDPTPKLRGPRCARQCGKHGVDWHSCPKGTAGPGTSHRPGWSQVTHGEAGTVMAEPVVLAFAAVTRPEPGNVEPLGELPLLPWLFFPDSLTSSFLPSLRSRSDTDRIRGAEERPLKIWLGMAMLLRLLYGKTCPGFCHKINNLIHDLLLVSGECGLKLQPGPSRTRN